MFAAIGAATVPPTQQAGGPSGAVEVGALAVEVGRFIAALNRDAEAGALAVPGDEAAEGVDVIAEVRAVLWERDRPHGRREPGDRVPFDARREAR